jgi:TRAP-type uncharacterized transport system substrate-binding protein
MDTADYIQRRRRVLLIGWLITLTGIVVAIWIAATWLSPSPPRVVGMAADSESIGVSALADQYREILARDGVELRLIPTVGAVNSIVRLRDSGSGVSVAILPDGTTTRREALELVSLGALFYEPIWFFYRGHANEPAAELVGKRISIGQQGSATRVLSIEFLSRAGFIDANDPTLLELAPEAAAEALRDGRIDAAVMLAPWQSPTIRQLLATPGLALLNIRRANAFVALYPYLNKVVVPAGVGDMAQDLPPHDVVLLAPRASLIVRKDLHPAIQYLLMKAASQIHSGPSPFNRAGQFPAAQSIDLPLSQNAIQYYKSGLPFLQRYLPFRWAVLAQQALLLVIPLIGVLYPLLRVLPALYGWIMRHRVFGLYGELKFLEDQYASGAPSQQRAELLERLSALDRRAEAFPVPLAFRPLLYALRLHIALVHQQIERAGNSKTD